jgi:photosystem II stability/assembly factor-like uncharacterized protein
MTAQLGTMRAEFLAMILALASVCGCEKHPVTANPPQPPPKAQQERTNPLSDASAEPAWTEVFTPLPAVDITAVGNTFWVCGADEMVASSSDGGATWKLSHHTRDGKILLHIAFASEKVGHAAGKGGLLLSTIDGGKTWTTHNVGDDVLAFFLCGCAKRHSANWS